LHGDTNDLRALCLQKCGPVREVRLTKKLQAGFVAERTNSGILEVCSVEESGHAYHQGLRQGDYIIALEGKKIPVNETVTTFFKRFQGSIEASGSEHILGVQRRVKKAMKSSGMPKLGVRRKNNQSNNTKKRKQNSAGTSNFAKRRKQ